jgi:hypothetical protein
VRVRRPIYRATNIGASAARIGGATHGNRGGGCAPSPTRSEVGDGGGSHSWGPRVSERATEAAGAAGQLPRLGPRGPLGEKAGGGGRERGGEGDGPGRGCRPRERESAALFLFFFFFISKTN